MLEILVILRDVILVTVLSWIGVDYTSQPDRSAEQRQAAKIYMQTEAPVQLISAPVYRKDTPLTQHELFRS
ncbi:hypothetical protein [Ponticaulis sp.]|uniref:hypothetical protein n=1 Tax=Ponticaulis sp. TaxID=2020902 RepID=UPI000B672E5F|nr:hypothetical protein [Ponticaulis sp.]MAJ08930.1 hypothetical protein [Ponticaulis sp.]MDF1681858.1 hypothetical protein [Ponticaulis sp.]RPG16728.1 MAG: hypothetical protein CBC85_007345 [Hyphomonadaceae bacterium TMED125]HBH89698.1 hypothetical protein [Hyphomonadaceae bacterium]|tara:strand:- start:187 stop:399 length:213 start_codon:yes stop_codon:yes gene_type:complete